MSLDFDAIRARADAATKGPWHLRGTSIVADVLISHDGPPGTEWNNSVVCSVGAWSSGRPTDADAEFIAHARTDVPALLAEIDRQIAAHTRTVDKVMADGWERVVLPETILDAIREHYATCRLSHPTNEDWFGCEARAVAAALTPGEPS